MTNFQKQARECPQKFRKLHRKTPLLESFLIKQHVTLFKSPVTLLKQTPTQLLSRKIYETFKNTYFGELLETRSSEILVLPVNSLKPKESRIKELKSLEVLQTSLSLVTDVWSTARLIKLVIRPLYSINKQKQWLFKIGVLKNVANFTGKHLCWGQFLMKLLIKKRLQHWCFPEKFAILQELLFLQNTSGGCF